MTNKQKECDLHQVGEVLTPLDLRGHLVGYYEGDPICVSLAGSRDTFLLIFSTLRKFIDFELEYDGLREIDNPEEFVDSAMSKGVRIAVDAMRKGDTIEFQEVIKPPPRHFLH